jgi:16S rRNA (guanine966-N2)-methyltransferase
MRIISGKYKSLNLLYPKKSFVRPTQDRVKESIFSILHNRVVDAKVLDLFSGTGGLGFEALSRGASKVVLVDVSVDYLKKNYDHIIKASDNNLDSEVMIVRKKVKDYLKSCREKFDIILIDPPWDRTDYYDESLKAISEFDILTKAGIVLCEHRKNTKIEVSLPWITHSVYRYGDTSLTFVSY